jgi:hypothetical protein
MNLLKVILIVHVLTALSFSCKQQQEQPPLEEEQLAPDSLPVAEVNQAAEKGFTKKAQVDLTVFLKDQSAWDKTPLSKKLT